MGSLVRAQEGEHKRAAEMLLLLFMMATVYILYSKKLDRFYIGSTKNFENRLLKHQTHYFGKEKFTSKADDWEIFLTIDCASEAQARLIEKHFKKMKSKIYISNLKKYPEMINALLIKKKDC